MWINSLWFLSLSFFLSSFFLSFFLSLTFHFQPRCRMHQVSEQSLCCALPVFLGWYVDVMGLKGVLWRMNSLYYRILHLREVKAISSPQKNLITTPEIRGIAQARWWGTRATNTLRSREHKRGSVHVDRGKDGNLEENWFRQNNTRK